MDCEVQCMTHLGNILKPGDVCLGYDTKSGNFAEDFVGRLKSSQLPDIILVKKVYAHKYREDRRVFELKRLPIENASDKPLKKSELARLAAQREAWLQDIEEDAELRSTINLYKRNKAGLKNANKQSTMEVDSDDGEYPDDVGMDELLDSMSTKLTLKANKGPGRHAQAFDGYDGSVDHSTGGGNESKQ
jgi:nonsense-mediated mRNA decay protein 3